jgi:hypothetical protein
LSQLSSLGKCGGWDSRDHDAFVRIWNSTLAGTEVIRRVLRHSNGETEEVSQEQELVQELENASDPATDDPTARKEKANRDLLAYEVQISSTQRAQLVKKMEFHVLGKSKEELLDHIDWHGKVLVLTARKKQLLAEWRKAQAQHRRMINAEIVAAEQAAEKGKAETELDEEHFAKEEAKARKIDELRITAKIRVMKWKADRQKAGEQEKMERQKQLERELREAAEEVSSLCIEATMGLCSSHCLLCCIYRRSRDKVLCVCNLRVGSKVVAVRRMPRTVSQWRSARRIQVSRLLHSISHPNYN